MLTVAPGARLSHFSISVHSVYCQVVSQKSAHFTGMLWKLKEETYANSCKRKHLTKMLAIISYHYHGNFYHKVVMIELYQVRYLWPEIPDRHPVYHEWITFAFSCQKSYLVEIRFTEFLTYIFLKLFTYCKDRKIFLEFVQLWASACDMCSMQGQD